MKISAVQFTFHRLISLLPFSIFKSLGQLFLEIVSRETIYSSFVPFQGVKLFFHALMNCAVNAFINLMSISIVRSVILAVVIISM